QATSPADTLFTLNAAGLPTLQWVPDAHDVDSLFELRISVQNLLTGCDSTYVRKIATLARPKCSFIADTVCLGDTTSFVNQSTIQSGTATYRWSFGDGTHSNQSAVSHSYNASGNYRVTLIATTNFGLVDSVVKQIVVMANPIAAFSAANVCVGDSFWLLNTSQGADSYQWSLGDGYTSLADSLFYNYAKAGAYHIQLIANTPFGCTDTVSKTIYAFGKPAAGFIINDNCLGDTTEITDTSSGANTIIWKLGNGQTTNMANPKYIYSSAAVYEVTQIAIGGNNCVDLAKHSISIHDLPTPALSVKDVCFDDSVSVQFNHAQLKNYDWQWGDSLGSKNASGKHFYKAAGTYQIVLTASSIYGCRVSDTVEVTVNNKPKAGFIANSVCEGFATSFTNTSSIKSGHLAANWRFGDGNSSTKTAPNYQYQNSGSYRVNLVVQSTNGCIDSTTETVIVKANPVPKFAVAIGCTNQGLQFANKTINGNSFKWIFGDGDSTIAKSPVHNYQFASAYKVKLVAISSNNCKASFDSIIKVRQSPKAVFTTNNACLGLPIGLSNYSTNASKYSWKFGDGNTSTSYLPKHYYNKDGTYTVQLTTESTGGCRDSATSTVKIYQKPIANFKTNNVCLGDTAFFTNESKNASSLSWSFGNGQSSNQINPNQFYSKSSTYDVRLIATAANACADTITKSITIMAVPSLKFTANASTCQGQNLTIDNKTKGANAYKWTFGDGNTSASATPIYAYKSSGAFWLKLAATSGSNCTLVDSVQVTVHPKPSTGFATKSECVYHKVGFVNSSSITKGKLNFQWTFGDGKGTSILRHPSYKYATAGVYQVKLLCESDFGCKDSVIKSDTVFARPQLSFSTDTVCQAETTSFTNNSQNATGFQWLIEGTTTTKAAPQFTFSNAGKNLVKLVGTSANGCFDTLSQTVLVYAKPIVLFTKNNACLNDSVKLKNFSQNANQFTWDFGDGTNSILANETHLYTASGKYTVTLSASNANGCFDSLQTTLHIYPNPTARFAVNDACVNDTNWFKNQSSGAKTFVWSFGDGITATAQNPNYVYALHGTYTTQLIAKTVYGCTDTATKTLNVFYNPVAQFSTNNICFGDSSYFTNMSSSASLTTWDFGDGNKSLQTSPAHLYKSAASYSVKLLVTTANSCKDSVTKTVVVNANPTADFTVNNVCLGDSSRLTNNSKNANKSVWNFGNGTNSLAWQPTFVYAKKGRYAIHIKVVSNEGCTDTLTKTAEVFPVPTAKFKVANACEGDTVFFKNKSTGHATSRWLFKNKTNSLLENPKKIFIKPGYQFTQLTVTNANGCTGTYTDSFLIYKKPITAFAASLYCANDSIEFNGNEIGNYQWRFGDGSWGSGRYVKHKYGSKGNYTIRVILVDTNSCKDTLFQNIFVRNNPEASFVHNNVCTGDSVFFTNKSTDAFTYKWIYDGITDTVSVNPVHYFSAAGYQLVKLIAFNPYGCKDSFATEVAIGDKPTIKFNLTNLCQKSPVGFNNKSTVNVGKLSYMWRFDNTIDSSENPIHVFSEDSVYEISLKAISEFGCVDSLTNSYKMKNNPTPILKLPAGCTGKELEFIASSPSAFSIKSIEWNLDGETILEDTFRQTFFYPGSHKVSMILELNNGCYNEVSREFVVANTPTSRFMAPLETCSGNKAEFIDLSSVNGSEELQYQWFFGNGFKSTIQDPVVVFAQAGDFVVKQVVSTTNGCADSSEKKIKINKTPDIAIEFREVGAKVFFDPKDTSLQNYYWDFGNGETSRFAQPSMTYSKNGQYFILLSAESKEGCKREVSKIINLTKTATGNSVDMEIDVYPNPFVEKITVRNSTANELTYLITSQSGVVLKRYSSDANVVQLDLNHLASGVYNLQVIGKDFMTIKQLIKL
ncbi:PKD domain-containing protein, partial [bacterium]|nr:PKD domain-containing protein [bacterium]